MHAGYGAESHDERDERVFNEVLAVVLLAKSAQKAGVRVGRSCGVHTYGQRNPRSQFWHSVKSGYKGEADAGTPN
jgi:hypothetical protein